MTKKQRMILILAGVLTGFCNGFFGAGGGMLAVPALEKYAEFPTKEAHATAILIILPLSIVSLVVYFLRGFAWDHGFFWVVPGGILGSIVGAKLLGKLSGKWIRQLFSLAMLGSGVWMLLA